MVIYALILWVLPNALLMLAFNLLSLLKQPRTPMLAHRGFLYAYRKHTVKLPEYYSVY